MLSCESSQVLIADGLYDQLTKSDEQELQKHLQECVQCRQVLDDVEAAKSALESRGISSDSYDDIPERAELDELWYRLQPSLDSIDAERYRQSRQGSRPFFNRWGPALAVAASLVLVLSIALATFDQPSSNPELVSAQPVFTTVDPELLQYLNRAQTMLMQVANTDVPSSSMVPMQQSFARNMAQEASFLTTAREESFSSGQSRLLKDIEYLLLQIANLDESNMEEGVALLQNYMEVNSILLRIRLVEMRNQEQVI
ncbi:MAG: zf-HC2 domain-containing protein [Gammaproteobacteria bacterium]